MAVDSDSRPRRRHHASSNSVASGRRRTKSSRHTSHKSTGSTKGGNNVSENKPVTVEELRKLRLDYLDRSPEEKRSTEMKYVYEPRDPPKAQSVRKPSGTRKSKKAPVSEHGHRRKKHRKAETVEDDSEYVYSRRLDERSKAPVIEAEEIDTNVSTNVSSIRNSRPDGGSIHRSATQRRRPSESRSDRIDEDVRRSSRQTESSSKREPRDRRQIADEAVERPKVRRAKTTRETTTERLSLRRSATTARSRTDVTSVKRSAPVRSNTDPASNHQRKSSGLFASLFGGGSTAHVPEKRVTCLTCMADDIPLSKSAKLACSHHMCHDCLKRIFKLSVSDPAHMPPRCCTSDHIPLKHVDKLFDMKFKVKWNKKYQEYMTRNRIYCPSRRCGEWIKPSQIHTEQGRKIGVCKRCHTRVCCLCNNKSHKSRECPKDEATKVFIETAQKEGWQRCFNCSAMVELKEGCNHMTCRCTAEFCMICGSKWKTCDCPWFNYNAVEADRLLNMAIPEARRAFANGGGRGPLRYQEELDRRREQERQDERLARRMQGLRLNNHNNNPNPNNDDHDPLPEGAQHVEIHGIGNAADHHLNDNFIQAARDLLTGGFRDAHRAADALLNGNVSGRENPLPPGPFEFDPAIQQPGQQMRRHGSMARRNPAVGALQDPAGIAAVVPGLAPQLSRRNSAAASPRTSGLLGRPDPSGRETGRRIERWMNGVG